MTAEAPSEQAAGPRCYQLGLIGYPLGHSRSPALHHAALAAAGLAGEYRLYALPPDETGLAQIAGLVADLRAGRLHGLNVTIPHKQNVMPLVDRLSRVARAVGAVNTLFRAADGAVVGDNTDAPGFLRDLKRQLGVPPGLALVLGAGGSARAVTYALGSAGWQVRVLARRAEQAEGLVAEIGRAAGLEAYLFAGDLQRDLPSFAASGVDLLVNTTPLGMFPKIEGCPWPDNLSLPAGAAVYDLIYNPRETLLLRQARAAGLHAANGAGMLIEQAILAFHCWTGIEPSFETMERAFPPN